MLFDPEDIERLSPTARVEVQDYYVRKHFADRLVVALERRAAKVADVPVPDQAAAEMAEAVDARRPWPRVWYQHDSSLAASEE
jgi:hypothetical protein